MSNKLVIRVSGRRVLPEKQDRINKKDLQTDAEESACDQRGWVGSSCSVLSAETP